MPTRSDDLVAEAAERFHGKSDHKHAGSSHGSNKARKSAGAKPKHTKKPDHAARSHSHVQSLEIITNQDYTVPEHPAPEEGKRTREQEIVERRDHVTIVPGQAHGQGVTVWKAPPKRRRDNPLPVLRRIDSHPRIGGASMATSYASVLRTSQPRRASVPGGAPPARPGVRPGAASVGRRPTQPLPTHVEDSASGRSSSELQSRGLAARGSGSGSGGSAPSRAQPHPPSVLRAIGRPDTQAAGAASRQDVTGRHAGMGAAAESAVFTDAAAPHAAALSRHASTDLLSASSATAPADDDSAAAAAEGSEARAAPAATPPSAAASTPPQSPPQVPAAPGADQAADGGEGRRTWAEVAQRSAPTQQRRCRGRGRGAAAAAAAEQPAAPTPAGALSFKPSPEAAPFTPAPQMGMPFGHPPAGGFSGAAALFGAPPAAAVPLRAAARSGAPAGTPFLDSGSPAHAPAAATAPPAATSFLASPPAPPMAAPPVATPGAFAGDARWPPGDTPGHGARGIFTPSPRLRPPPSAASTATARSSSPPLPTQDSSTALFPASAAAAAAAAPPVDIEAQERAALGERRAALRRSVRATLERFPHCRYDNSEVAAALSVEEHIEGLDMMLGLVEAAMVHALTVHHDDGDAARGNVTRAAFMLHHCLQSDLFEYTGLDPWRCGSTEHWRPVVTLPPFPSCAEAAGATCSHAEFDAHAKLFTNMECNLARANEVYCVFTQVDLPAHPYSHGDTGKHTQRTDNLFTRFAVVGLEIAKDAARRGESGEEAFSQLLERLERFVHDAAPHGFNAECAVHNGGHHDALSVLNYSGSADDTIGGESLGGERAQRPFCVLFTPPDDQWRPPVVAMIVISILYHLLNSVRYVLMYAVDRFKPRELPAHADEAALRAAHRRIVLRYTDFGERLSEMLVSITEQIARRLMREDRMLSLHGRFRPDSVMWSWLLKQANSTLIIGSRAPQTEFQGGTLEHLARVLLVQQRDATAHGVATEAPAHESDIAHLDDAATDIGIRACKRIYSAIDAQLRLLRRALCDMTAALRGPEAPPTDDDAPLLAAARKGDLAAIPLARRQRIVAEYRRLKRDGRNMQFAVYVKNLEGVYDIMRGIVDVANDYEHHGLAVDTREQYIEFQRLSDSVVDVLKAYMVFWLCNMEVLRSYLRDHELDFRWDEQSQQYLEFSGDQPLHDVRGFSRYTLDALACVLQNGYLTVHYLMLLRDKTAIERPTDPERQGVWGEAELAAYARAQINKDLCEHIVQTLLEAGTIDPQAVEELMICEQEQVAQLIANAKQNRSVLLAHLRGHSRKRHMILQLCLSRRRVAADPDWDEPPSRIGWVHKHKLELPDRTEVNVAIKWIQMRGASRSSSGSAPPRVNSGSGSDASPEDSLESLQREHEYLMRVTDSLMPPLVLPRASSSRNVLNGIGDTPRSASVSSLNGGAATPRRARSVVGGDGQQPPEGGIPEHANVVVGYGICSSLPMAMTKRLRRPNLRPDEVVENSKVGIGMEFLPTGTVGEVLLDRRREREVLADSQPVLTLRAAIDTMLQHATGDARVALQSLEQAAQAPPQRGGKGKRGAAAAEVPGGALARNLFAMQRIGKRSGSEIAFLQDLGSRMAALVPLWSSPTPKKRGSAAAAAAPTIYYPSRAPCAPHTKPRLCLLRYLDDSRSLGTATAPGGARGSSADARPSRSASPDGVTALSTPRSDASDGASASTAASGRPPRTNGGTAGKASAASTPTWASKVRAGKPQPQGPGPGRRANGRGANGAAAPQNRRSGSGASSTPAPTHVPEQEACDTHVELFYSFAGVFAEHYTECGAEEAACRGEFQKVLTVLATVSFRWCLQLMLGMAKGVALCHRLGVVHRDINVHNFMLDGWGRVKLIDYASAAKDGARQHGPPQDHVVFQPPGARELESFKLKESLKMPDASSADDVWSLGMALWTVVFLRPLHGGKTCRNPLDESWEHADGDRIARAHSHDLLRALHHDHCTTCIQERERAAACKCEAAAPPSHSAQGWDEHDAFEFVHCGLCRHALRKEDYWRQHVPPLPLPDKMRAVFFRGTLEQAAAEDRRWKSDGLPRLQRLFVSMFRLKAEQRVSAFEVAQRLQELLDDFPAMV